MPTRKVDTYPKSKCLPGEHMRPEITCWGLYFLNHDKEYAPIRKIDTYPKSKCLPGK